MVEKTIVLNAETEKATQNVDAFNKGLKETDKSTKKLNKDLKDMTLAEMDVFWEEAKKL